MLLTGIPGPALDLIKGLGVNHDPHARVLEQASRPTRTPSRAGRPATYNPRSIRDAAWAPYDEL